MPLNAGIHFHAATVDAEPNWPNVNSVAKIGMPQKKSMRKYGMKNTPPPLRKAK